MKIHFSKLYFSSLYFSLNGNGKTEKNPVFSLFGFSSRKQPTSDKTSSGDSFKQKYLRDHIPRFLYKIFDNYTLYDCCCR